MFKNFIKLSRRLLILAVLCGGLLFVLGVNSGSVNARGYCCWECAEAELGCEHICDFLPNSPGCASCQAFLEECWGRCSPSPTCGQ